MQTYIFHLASNSENSDENIFVERRSIICKTSIYVAFFALYFSRAHYALITQNRTKEKRYTRLPPSFLQFEKKYPRMIGAMIWAMIEAMIEIWLLFSICVGGHVGSELTSWQCPPPIIKPPPGFKFGSEFQGLQGGGGFIFGARCFYIWTQN